MIFDLGPKLSFCLDCDRVAYCPASVSGQKTCTKFAHMAKLVVIGQVNWRDPTMRGRKPNRFRVRPGDASELLQIARSQGLPWFQVQRARIVFSAGSGQQNRGRG